MIPFFYILSLKCTLALTPLFIFEFHSSNYKTRVVKSLLIGRETEKLVTTDWSNCFVNFGQSYAPLGP